MRRAGGSGEGRPGRRAASLALLAGAAALACRDGRRPPAPEAPGGAVVFRTGDAPKGAALPRVVLLHGLGDSAEGIAPLLRDLPEAAEVFALDAPRPYGQGRSWFPIEGGGWSSLGPALAAAADALAARIRPLAAERPPIVTGFSQGGMLAFTLAVRHPELVAAAVPIGGLLPASLRPEAAPAGAPPIRALHGAADRVVPASAARATIRALEGAGFDATLHELEGVGHGIPPAGRAWLFATLRAQLAPR